MYRKYIVIFEQPKFSPKIHYYSFYKNAIKTYKSYKDDMPYNSQLNLYQVESMSTTLGPLLKTKKGGK